MSKIFILITLLFTSIITTAVYHSTQKAGMEYYQGHRHYSKGAYEKAIPFYERSLNIDPASGRTLEELGYSCLWTGKRNEAINLFHKALALKPDNYPVMKALADTLAWEKRYRESIELFQHVIKHTGDPSAMVSLAEVCQWDGKFEKSKEILRALPKARSEEPYAKLLYAKALVYTKDTDKAAELLEELMASNAVKRDRKMYAETEKLFAEVLVQEKDYSNAIERYKKRVKADPEDILARIMLADMLSWVKRYDESVAEYEEVLKREPDNIEAKRKLAGVYSWMKEYGKSEALLKDVLAKDRGDVESRILYADIMSWQKRYDEAISEYEKALELGRSDPAVLKKLGDAAAWSKDYDRAERVYRLILTKDPSDNKARIALAALLSWKKNYGLSIEEYEKALAAEPGNTEIKEALADVLSWSKDYVRAEALYREVVASDPSNIRAESALGEVLLWQKKYPEAIEHFKALLERKDDPKVKLMYAKALLYSADYEASRGMLEGIVAEEPDNAEAIALLADSYAYTKEFAKAEEMYRKALSKGDDRTIKRKLADVLSWDRKYAEAVRIYDELLKTEPDTRMRLQKARILGWSRKYDRALMEYKALAEASKDPYVKLEMDAKAAYWDGRVMAAIAIYRKLASESADNVEAMFDLAQISSYESMWKEAIGEYKRILKLAPNHFRAKDGLARAELVSSRFSWEPGYEFVEADSQSRDMDIRKHSAVNSFGLPVNDRVRFDATSKLTFRSFSDFSRVIENEEKIKLSYNFNPRLAFDGYYDLIAYNKDISAMHNFGSSVHCRVTDSAIAHFWYKRDRLENNSTVIADHYYSDDLKERLDISLDKHLKLGADFLYSSISDNNERWEPGFDVLYFLTLDPKRLSVKYRYFYRQFEDKVPQYFSPKGFTTNAVTFNWRHFLNKEEIFFGADDIYYDLAYTFSVDSETIAGHSFTGMFHWDITKRLSFNVEAGFSLSSNTVYKDSGLKGSFKYYF